MCEYTFRVTVCTMHELRPETAPPTTLYCFNRSNYGFRMLRIDDDDDGQQQQQQQQLQQK